MNTNVCVEVCRAIFPGMKWFVLENGTLLYLRDVPEVDDAYVIGAMSILSKALGPYNGEGSVYGDCIPRKLLKFTGWIVHFGVGLDGICTYVGPEEMEGASPPSKTEMFLVDGKAVRATDAPFETRVALFGRHKRNLDARDPKIVARSTDTKTVGGT
jgi:hypothetical protein